jgi:hypothetical protein
MPFFTNSDKVKITNVPAQSPSTYADADYYIANTPTGSAAWQIEQIPNSIDTSIASTDGTTGPDDYNGYYNTTNAAKLFIRHVPTGYSVAFPAILKTYSDSFSPSFNPEQVYGRMDPIQKYQNTSRKISLGFTVVAYDEDHAHRNLHALSALVEFLYPVYDRVTNTECSNATAIRESPLLRVRFANLIQKNGRVGGTNGTDSYINNGLLVAPTSFAFSPNAEAGYFFHGKDYLFPKEISISMDFSVLHEETPGWIKGQSEKYEWIGKLDSELKSNGTTTDFPWGNDTTTTDIILAETAAEAAASTTGKEQITQAAQTSPTTV